ncbi:MAG: hypothetical protein Q4P65_04420 [Eubacteriales bacterium]|nr:hypothetical protein [Eubacteriales bacterium]
MKNIVRKFLVLFLVASFIICGPLSLKVSSVRADDRLNHENTDFVVLPLSPKIQRFLLEKGLKPEDFRAYVPSNELDNLSYSYEFGEDELNLEPASVSGVAIFIAGILVGYIIDGLVIVATGQSAGQWVAEAYIWVNKGIHNMVTKLIGHILNGKAVITHGTNSSGNCVQRVPGGPILCVN